MNRKTKTICIHVDEERLKELHIRAAQSQKSLNDLSKEALSVVEKMEDILRPEQQEHGGMRFG